MFIHLSKGKNDESIANHNKIYALYPKHCLKFESPCPTQKQFPEVKKVYWTIDHCFSSGDGKKHTFQG
jgi:hypothetical protein